MPKAEVGSTKYLSNKMKMKGLGRLRWYCQVCEKQCRDQNGFKMHTQSESHVRQMLVVGEDAKKHIDDYSSQFLRDFTQQLKTSHGEKSVHINHFYQDYIHNKEHVHMNATRWPSLTEFAKHLGREGICRVEETEKGLHIAWIDDSPEALRRKDAIRRKEMQDKGDEEREQRMIREQIKRANKEAKDGADNDDEANEAEDHGLQRQEGEKIKLSFGAKPAAIPNVEPSPAATQPSSSEEPSTAEKKEEAAAEKAASGGEASPSEPPAKPTPAPISMKLAAKPPQAKNVFAAAKKNALAGGSKKPAAFQQAKPMSQAEKIMREEMERKRAREGSGSAGFSFPNKRQKQ